MSVFGTKATQQMFKSSYKEFYHAMRSGDIKLLEGIINDWPGKHPNVNFRELVNILSQTYEELKLKNVPLSEYTEILVEHKLINLRFFSNTGAEQGHDENYYCLDSLKKQIQLVLYNISLLITEYWNKVDEKFLYIVKFIAKNIHILKQQLKSTYNKIPWEEMEFCLCCFWCSYTKPHEINLFYYATLNKDKLLRYLKSFENALKNVDDNLKSMNVSHLATLPQLHRDAVVAGIIKIYPQFEEFYKDYEKVRDMELLYKISGYIEVALTADPTEKEERLVIVRVLDVIGECFRNNLQSPNFSSNLRKHLEMILSRDTRKTVLELCNSSTHVLSLIMRTRIEENMDVDFFLNAKIDMKRMYDLISDFVNKNKIKIIRKFVEKITTIEKEEEISEIAEIFRNCKLDQINGETFKLMMEHDQLKKLIQEFYEFLKKKPAYEELLLNRIYGEINNRSENELSVDVENGNNYVAAFLSFTGLCMVLNDDIINSRSMTTVKYLASKILNITTPFHALKGIGEMSVKIAQNAILRLPDDKINTIKQLASEICFVTEFEINGVELFERFRIKLNIDKPTHLSYPSNEKFNNQFEEKLSELKSILNNNRLSSSGVENIFCRKRNKNCLVALELLVQDVITLMPILGYSSDHPSSNFSFLDEFTPLLSGTSLLNHLSHDNMLFHTLMTDPAVAVISNAENLVSKNFIKTKKKIEKFADHSSKFKSKHEQSISVLDIQNEMFAAIEKNKEVKHLKIILVKGADLNCARKMNSWTAIHVASRFSTLLIVKFIVQQNVNVKTKDINGRNALHIAATFGKKDIVEYFIIELKMDVDEYDKNKKTPLHFAAQNGHKEIVEFLLTQNADYRVKDTSGYLPLHYALNYNHTSIAKMLLEKEMEMEKNDSIKDVTTLNVAAESENVEMVNLLLSKGANVNAENYKEGNALHGAVRNGQLDVVDCLVSCGVNVNSRLLGGCAPLHFAAENGHVEMVDVLLKNRADVNCLDKLQNWTPLHYAAKKARGKVAFILLSNGALVDSVSANGMTPLHLAAHFGHFGIVISLVASKVDVNYKDKIQRTALHFAACEGHTQVLQLLVNKGANVNSKSTQNRTPLHEAVEGKGSKDMVEFLLQHGADVKTEDIKGNTPLHLAAMKDNADIMEILINNNADVDVKNNDGRTPLHLALLMRNKKASDLLFKHEAIVNTKDIHGSTPILVAAAGDDEDLVNLLIEKGAIINDEYHSSPLHVAVEQGNKKFVELLIANGADVNIVGDDVPPLYTSIVLNNKEIFDILIQNGASVNIDSNPLLLAVLRGYKDFLEILLKNHAQVNTKDGEHYTPLHLAAILNNKGILAMLLKYGADVKATDITNKNTPLHIAAEFANDDAAEILIKYKSDVNARNNRGFTPFQLAAECGHGEMAKILLKNRASVKVQDALENAVTNSKEQILNALLLHGKANLNGKGKEYLLLHLASSEGNLKMVKFLVEKGADVNATDKNGLKPIHDAAICGHKDIIEYFLSIGMDINEPGEYKKTLMHYAAQQGQVEVVKYLISKGAIINAEDANGVTCILLANFKGFKEIIEVLFENGAIYKYEPHVSALFDEYSEVKVNILELTDMLFEAVKRNRFSKIKDLVEEGAVVNGKKPSGDTALHFAATKGYGDTVNALIENGGNPNAIGKDKFTPIHHAAKFSQIKIVKTLLTHGAIYNSLSVDGKTPLALTSNKEITELLTLINQSFEKIKKGDESVINDLRKVKKIDTIRAVMSARNTENMTLMVFAKRIGFPKVNEFKNLWQQELDNQIKQGSNYLKQGKYVKAMVFFKKSLHRNEEILGPDNPSALEIKCFICKVKCNQRHNDEALQMLEEIYEKQKETIGPHNEDTLGTKLMIAEILNEQGKRREALETLLELHEKQTESMGPDNLKTIDTLFLIALLLKNYGKFVEATAIFREVFRRRKEVLGEDDMETVRSLYEVGKALFEQGSSNDECLEIFKEVLEKRKMHLSGENEEEVRITIRNERDVGVVLFRQRKYVKALQCLERVLNIQKMKIGEQFREIGDYDIWLTQFYIAKSCCTQGEWQRALQLYEECLEGFKLTMGLKHPMVLEVSKEIEVCKLVLRTISLEEEFRLSGEFENTLKKLSLFQLQDVTHDDFIKMKAKEAFEDVENGQVEVLEKLEALQDLDFDHITKLRNEEGRTLVQVALIHKHKDIAEKLIQMIKDNNMRRQPPSD